MHSKYCGLRVDVEGYRLATYSSSVGPSAGVSTLAARQLDLELIYEPGRSSGVPIAGRGRTTVKRATSATQSFKLAFVSLRPRTVLPSRFGRSTVLCLAPPTRALRKSSWTTGPDWIRNMDARLYIQVPCEISSRCLRIHRRSVLFSQPSARHDNAPRRAYCHCGHFVQRRRTPPRSKMAQDTRRTRRVDAQGTVLT